MDGRRVLVIGGTSFIGRATVEALLRTGALVTILNRGKSLNPFGAAVHHIKCDRRRHPKKLQSHLELGWDAVVDFVAFDPEDVEPVLLSASALGRYILISTDSVYMAVDPCNFERASNRLLETSDAQGPSEERASLDQYGADKLAAEQALRFGGREDLDWIAFRLPDVLGPFENTGRMERLLVKLCKGRRIGLAIDGVGSAAETLPLGLVFADDVANAVVAALRAPRLAHLAPTSSRALHVCCDEAPTWRQLVELFASELRAHGVDVPPVRFDPGRGTGFVSTDFGALNGRAALAALAGVWRPASVAERVRECVEWWTSTMRRRFEAVAARTTAAGSEAPEVHESPDSDVHAAVPTESEHGDSSLLPMSEPTAAASALVAGRWPSEDRSFRFFSAPSHASQG